MSDKTGSGWSPASVKHILAIASCKGGVGKTTVSVNLALALRRRGTRVGLYDADLYGPNVPLMLGIRGRAASFPLSVPDARGQSVGMIPVARRDTVPYIQPFRRFGTAVMSVGLWFGETEAVMDPPSFGAEMIRQTFQDVLWGELDFLLLDFPPGTGEPQQTLMSTIRIDGVIIVTTPQELSLMDTGRSIQYFRNRGVPILGVVENMSYMVCPNCGKELHALAGERDQWPLVHDVPVLGRLPLDPALSRRIDADHPLTQLALDSPQALALGAIADRVQAMFGRGDGLG